MGPLSGSYTATEDFKGRFRVPLWLREIADFFLPRRCPVCFGPADLSDSAFCRTCLEGFSFIESPRCTLCGTPFKSPFQEDHLCMECMEGRFGFDGAFSVFFYRDTLREAIHRFKYSGRVILAGALADFLLHSATGWVKDHPCDVLVPVPSRRESIRARGFNPSILLARGVHKAWGLPLGTGGLRLRKKVVSQAGLNRSERLRNVQGAFAADPKQVSGRRVLLLDDVMTTGATTDQCARALKRAGAEKVFVVTLARTVAWDILRSRGSDTSAGFFDTN